MEVDDLRTKTWPQVLGVRKTIAVSIGLNAIGLIGISYKLENQILFLVITLFASWAIYFMDRYIKAKETYISFAFEGLLGLYGWIFYLLF